MSDLVTWYLAQLDADEAAARAAMVVIGDDMTEYRIAEWWEKPEHSRVYAGHWHPVVQAGETHGDPVFYNTAALPHIARHDPARVLAEVAAKRAIVQNALNVIASFGDSDADAAMKAGGIALWPDVTRRERQQAHDTIATLASVFEGAPGWQEEWR